MRKSRFFVFNESTGNPKESINLVKLSASIDIFVTEMCKASFDLSIFPPYLMQRLLTISLKTTEI